MNKYRHWGIVRKGSILAAAALIAVLAALLFSLTSNRQMGFPLDDAWIHQTYARNLGQIGEWVYRPGDVSAGSTAPLWTFLLSLGYHWSAEPAFGWTLTLGWLGLLLTGLFAELLLSRLVPGYSASIPWAGLFVICEWHQLWAALSGMETGWMAALYLLVFLLLTGTGTLAWIAAGAATALAMWMRPDSLTLLGPLFFIGAWLAIDRKLQIRNVLLGFTVFVIVASGYFLFNYQVGGALWPNTFFAKQIEYSAMQSISVFSRFGSVLIQPMIGPGILMLPGFLYANWKAIKEKNAVLLAMSLWWLGISLIYALRLPVTYQHGRYMMPAMPVFWLIGLAGWLAFWRQPRKYPVLSKRLWLFGGKTLLGLVSAAFLLLGIQAYQQDSAIINAEMVNTAVWIKNNLPDDAILGVHDIGAVGFYTENPIVDLAGLISPEVIPFMSDEQELGRFLTANHVQYLVTFPTWYSHLTNGLQTVYQSDSTVAPALGGENMTIYAWSANP
jgi:hypothetical protein